MTKEEILEGNKLISKFMGYLVKYEPTYQEWVRYDSDGKGGISFDSVLYNTSWHWIMPVYKKCYDTWRIHLETSELCKDIFEDIWDALWKCKIDELFENIVEFIEWYNQEIKKDE